MDSIPTIQSIDLSSLRETSDLTDVKFIFSDPGNKGDKVIKANKTILACGSEVFKTQFFGSIPGSDSVPVQDSSIEIFSIFVDVLYNIKVDLKEMSLKLLGKLFYLAEKYHVDGLKDAIIKNVLSRKIEANDLIEANGVAEENAFLLDFATSVNKLCSDFVLNNNLGFLELCYKLEVEESTSATLHILMAKAYSMRNMMKPICKNCRHHPCLDGKPVTKDNFVEDASLKSIRFLDENPYIRKAVKVDGTTISFKLSGFKDTYMCEITDLVFKCK